MAWKVIGQNKAVSLLQRSLETGTLAHAYLFAGPAHVGKMRLALELAKALNCQSPDLSETPTGSRKEPCGVCPSCLKIESGKHADVQVMLLNAESSEDNRTKILVSQIEDLQHSVSLPPFEGRFKVFIIDGAENLSIGAANRLLKTLEEPSGRVVFVLLSSDEGLLLPTIVSRCQRIELFLMSAAHIEVALKEKGGVDAEKAKLLSRLAHGCLGWAFETSSDAAVLEKRETMLDRICEVIEGDTEDRFAYSGELANQFSQNRKSVYSTLDLWLDWWRDLMLMKTESVESVTNIDRLETLAGMAGTMSLPQIRDFIQSIWSAGAQLSQNAGSRLVLDVLMLDIPEIKENHIVGSGVQ